MQQPFATVDGSVYGRGPMEEWIRRRRQNNSPPTSPLTGLERPNLTLLLVPALKGGYRDIAADNSLEEEID